MEAKRVKTEEEEPRITELCVLVRHILEPDCCLLDLVRFRDTVRRYSKEVQDIVNVAVDLSWALSMFRGVQLEVGLALKREKTAPTNFMDTCFGGVYADCIAAMREAEERLARDTVKRHEEYVNEQVAVIIGGFRGGVELAVDRLEAMIG